MELAWAFAGLGHDVHFIAPSATPATARERELLNGVAVHQTPKLNSGKLFGLLRRIRPDLARLMTGAFPPDTRLAPAIHALGIPLVESLHLFRPTARLGKGRSLTYRVFPRRRWRIALSNETLRNAVVERAPNLAPITLVLQQGVRLPEASGAAPGAPCAENQPVRAISVCRLDETDKDVSTLLHAFARLRNDRQQRVTLRIVGDGRDSTALQQSALELGIAHLVDFAGWREDVEAELRDADFFVLSTRGETFGRVCVEAASLGLPVIATDVPGCRDRVRHGHSGLLVPQGDAGAMADAIRRLSEDPDLRQRFGERGRTEARRFDVRRWAEDTLEVAEELGQSRPRRSSEAPVW